MTNYVHKAVSELDPSDRARLVDALGLRPQTSEKALISALEPFAAASFAEYLDQLVARRVPSRMVDQQQLRLLHIAQHVYGGSMPNPDIVARLFHKTHREAKTLIRNSSTRYRYELQGATRSAAWAVLQQAVALKPEAKVRHYRLEVRDDALLEYMRDAVRRGPGFPGGIKTLEDLHTYSCDRETITSLLSDLGKTPADFDKEVAPYGE